MWLLLVFRGVSFFELICVGGSGPHCCVGFAALPWAGLPSGCGRGSCRGLQAVLHRLRSRGTWDSCPVARGIVPDQVSNPCLLPWQVGSYPLYHWGSPCVCILNKNMLPISRSWRYSHMIPFRKFIYHLLFLGLEMCMNKFLFDMTYSLRLISLSS